MGGDSRAAAALRPVRIGCSGWNYQHWRDVVYLHALPATRRLEHYAVKNALWLRERLCPRD